MSVIPFRRASRKAKACCSWRASNRYVPTPKREMGVMVVGEEAEPGPVVLLLVEVHTPSAPVREAVLVDCMLVLGGCAAAAGVGEKGLRLKADVVFKFMIMAERRRRGSRWRESIRLVVEGQAAVLKLLELELVLLCCVCVCKCFVKSEQGGSGREIELCMSCCCSSSDKNYTLSVIRHMHHGFVVLEPPVISTGHVYPHMHTHKTTNAIHVASYLIVPHACALLVLSCVHG